ncbi:Pimeloyl-ACP methyl ester carboxylesterase [Actinomadura madurae]|uniref:Pimeloyl-ACP methyl ester carboxylesterase n=1 Tax=Actinomadura madurae TaxID=1993 RepID=A0A1I5I030_9ACTN|nr:alpha/beta hydrolase [Actinomadura madurae]SFO53486.1 Pimeloyl-ACP methyl ester carboxylesterase [Actinomadura madurae]
MSPTEIRSRFVDVGGIRTHYLEAGDAQRTVVLLHSGEFGASAELCWERNIPAFAEHFRVVAPDWLGFGETDKLHDFVSKSDRMMRHMAAFLRVLAIDEAHFAGASMGATRLVAEAARPSPRLPIAAMVLVSGGGFVPDNPDRRVLLDYDGTPEGMRAILRACLNDPRWAEDEGYVARRVQASLRPGAWEAVAATRLKAPNLPPRSDFGQADTIPYEDVTVPTLAFAGAKDRLREPGYHQALGRIPGARVEVFDEAGHLLNIERAERFNRLAVDFLLGLERR